MNYSLKFTVELPKDSRLENSVCLHYFKHSVSESDLLRNVLFYFPPLFQDVLLSSLPAAHAQFLAHPSPAVTGSAPGRCERSSRPPACPGLVPRCSPAAIGVGETPELRRRACKCREAAFKFSAAPAAVWATNALRGYRGLMPAAPAPGAAFSAAFSALASPPALYAHECA